MANTSSDKILLRLKGLRAQMRTGEQPLFTTPVIWENATDHQSNACDLVLTNQRLFGYIYKTFPRERLFLDDLELSAITTVSIRQKNFSAMFRELLVSDKQKRIYIRATGKKIEETYTTLRGLIAEHAPTIQTTLAASAANHKQTQQPDEYDTTPDETANGTQILQLDHQEQAFNEPNAQSPTSGGPTYSRQHIRQPLERSPLGITVLLVGGLILEIIGIVAWAAIDNPQMGITLILTGLLAVIIAILARRQLH